MHPKKQSRIQARQVQSSLFLTLPTNALSAWMNATSKEPRQMEPKLYVVERNKESRNPWLQQEFASSGATHLNIECIRYAISD